MKHLPIPFEEKGIIEIFKNEKSILRINVELASSSIEHYQALSFRQELSNGGLAFVFENPNLPSLVNTKVPFAVDTIQLDEAGEITHIGSLSPSNSDGVFTTSFQTKFLLMLPFGFCLKQKLISKNESESKKQKPFRIEVSNYWIHVYRQTKFTVIAPEISIQISVGNSKLNSLLKKNRCKSWAYITAFNPVSSLASEIENETKHKELISMVSKYPYFIGEGVGEDSTWTPEKSLLILGISESKAIEIGEAFKQNAIVIGRINSLPELKLLTSFYDSGNSDLGISNF